MKPRRSAEGMNLDFLMDTVTNVVGILILILVLNSLNITRTVQRIRRADPSQFGITPEQLDQITQQSTEQRQTLVEMLKKAREIETQLVRDRQAIQQQQNVLEVMRRDDTEPKPTTDPVPELKKIGGRAEEEAGTTRDPADPGRGGTAGVERPTRRHAPATAAGAENRDPAQPRGRRPKGLSP